jgi:hypothetical protein
MPRAARQESPQGPDPVLDGPNPHMHSGKCSICRHPQRAEIERAFVDWTSPREIAKLFGLRGHATVYRHAHARGLFELRRGNPRIDLGRIADHADNVDPSATNVRVLRVPFSASSALIFLRAQNEILIYLLK